MRRFLILLFCCIIIFNGCDYNTNEKLNNDNVQERGIFTSNINDEDNSGFIVYGRYGEEKEICSVNSDGKKYEKIYNGEYEKASGRGEKIVFYSKKEEEKGVYIVNSNEKRATLLLDSFRLTQKPCFSKDGSLIAFYAYPKYDPKDNEQYIQRLYYMNLNRKELTKINNVKGELKHISFIDNENIIYSKLLQDKGVFQIFKYSIKENIETRLINSDFNDVNPVVSPDGTKVAFLSDKYSNYNLYILNLNNNAIQELDTNEAVVGESVVWSPDGLKIAYVTLSGVTKYSVKLAEVKQNNTISIGNGYLAAFSTSGKSLIYAAYEINNKNEFEKKQTIFRMNIDDRKTERVWSFPEISIFSRSIKLLYWTDSVV